MNFNGKHMHSHILVHMFILYASLTQVAPMGLRFIGAT